jgi:hypothetical protein
MPLVRTDDRRYARDTESNALLSTDKTALERTRAQRAMTKRTSMLQLEVNALREQVQQLVSLFDRSASLDKGL